MDFLHLKKRLREGLVISDRMEKTRCIEVTRQFRHPLYEKVLRRRKHYLAHDKKNISHTGDIVLVREIRPLSNRKRWEVVKVKKQGRLGDSKEQHGV